MKELLDMISDLRKKFEAVQPSLHLRQKQDEIASLQSQMEQSGFWDDQGKAQKISQKMSWLRSFLQKWNDIASSLSDLPDLIEMANAEEMKDMEDEARQLKDKFEEAETELLLSGEYDQGNAILSLHVGNGGQDAEDFCQMLLRMYLRFSESKGWKVTVLEESASDAGLKSVMVRVEGLMVYGMLQGEHGVHRLIRLSPFNAKNLRQTSFARVEVLPEIEDETSVEIDEKDLRVDVFRSSGSGGQSVNTTDSAVRITYLPLNVVVTCQNEKSQLQNKQSAMKVLKSRLLKLQLEQKAQKLEELRGDLMEAAFGSQIRTYTLQPYKLVKDHRTDFEYSNPDKVFDGDLDGFVQSYLRNK